MARIQEVLGKNRLGEKDTMKTCVILPAYNEAANISKVIRGIKSLNIDVIVIDDGSKDQTSQIAERENVYLIRHNRRRGKGSTLKDGFDYAIRQRYDIIIIMDADGQHEPSDIPRFIDKAKEAGVSVVIGNRMSNPTDMPPNRIFTNRFMSSIIAAICHQTIPDTQCGYRLFTREALESIDIRGRKFEIDSELLIKLARKGYKIESLPIRSIYAGEKSQIRPIWDSIRFIRLMIKILLHRE